MFNQILEFRMSNHFMLRGWDRSIDRALLYKVLPFVECTDCVKDTVLVMPSFLKKKGIARDDKQCLLLIIRSKLLVTGYWCKNPNQVVSKNDKSHFQILY